MIGLQNRIEDVLDYPARDKLLSLNYFKWKAFRDIEQNFPATYNLRQTFEQNQEKLIQ